jgi:cobalt-zinc-cadmium efflux system membrane fusion protein
MLMLVACSSILGCKHEVSRAPEIASAGRGEVGIDPELIRNGRIQLEPVTVSVETITVRTSGRAGFNEEHLSYVSSPLTGRVAAIQARPGERVAPGQTLAVIDSPDLGATWSEHIKARADLVMAERSFALARDLTQFRAVARKDLQRAEDELVKARTDVRRTRERLLSLGAAAADVDAPIDDLHIRSQFNLTAPIAGSVIERNLTLGQLVGGDPAQRLYVIADLTSLWVTADVYEKDLPLVRPGQEVAVTTAAWPDQTFSGRIQYIGDTVDPSSRTVKVRLEVDNHEQRLKPEMFVTASIRTEGTASLLSIPLAALHGEGLGQPYVFVAVDSDHFVPRAVGLGDKFGDRVVVSGGLSKDDRIVTQGSILLKAEAARQTDS